MYVTRLLIHVTDALINVTSLLIRPTGLLIGVTGTLIQIFRPKKAIIRYQGRLRRRASPNAPIRLGPNGRGGQVFLGPYVGWLLGGTYPSTTGSARGTSVSGGTTFSGDVKTGDTYATSTKDTNYYFRKLDAGAQLGVGYGFEALQLQASFSYGLRDIGAAYAPNAGNPYQAPVIHNYGFQVSASYLFSPKN